MILDSILVALLWILKIGAFLSILALVTWFIYLKRQMNYWRSKGIPTMNLYESLYLALNITKKGVHDLDKICFEKYGRFYVGFLVFQPSFFVSDPRLLKKILITDFDYFPNRRLTKFGDKVFDNTLPFLRWPQWGKTRRIFTSNFSPAKLKSMEPSVWQCCRNVTSYLLEATKRNETQVDMKLYVNAFLSDIITSCYFGMKMNPYKDFQNQFLKNARGIFDNDYNWRLSLLATFPFLTENLKISFTSPSVLHFFKSIYGPLIEKGLSDSKEKPKSLLQYLLNGELKRRAQDGEALSWDELIAQGFNFHVGTFDSMTCTLSYFCYAMALHPEIQEKLCQEIDQAFDNHDELNYAVIREMEYLDCCLYEVWRYFPPLGRPERHTAADYYVPEYDITIPKGMIVAIPLMAVHRDPDSYPDPDTFNPENYRPDVQQARPSLTFLTFGAGQRICPGINFAHIACKFVLTNLFRHLKFHIVPDTKCPPGVYTGCPLNTPKSVVLGISARRDMD